MEDERRELGVATSFSSQTSTTILVKSSTSLGGLSASLQNSINLETTQSSKVARECIICIVELWEEQFPKKPPTEACSHPPEVCIECLRRVIAVGIKDGNYISGILCPSDGCRKLLGYFDVKSWATIADFERWALP